MTRLFSRLRQSWFAYRGVSFGEGCHLAGRVHFSLGIRDGEKGRVRLHDQCNLQQGVLLDAWGGSIEIMRNVFIGPYTVIYGHGGVSIGAESLIAAHCRIFSSSHTISPPDIAMRTQPDLLQPTGIGRDVWLGAGVTVLGGVRIGDGCVVGAGSVVTSDLPDFSVAVGAPARVIRYRS